MRLHKIIFDHLLDALQIVDYLDTATSVSILTRLYDPVRIRLKAFRKLTKFLLLVHLF